MADRIPAPEVRRLASDRHALTRLALVAAFPEEGAPARATEQGVRIRAEIGCGGGVRGLLIWREGRHGSEFARLHSDGISASVVRRKVVALFTPSGARRRATA